MLNLRPLAYALLAAFAFAFFTTPPRATPTRARPAPKQTRRALLVGIEHYRNAAFPELRGPLNDVRELGQLLTKKYGFQVQTLPEAEAKRDGIIAAFRKYLVADAEPGDVCLFYFSGHGTQIKNTSGVESDNLDEALIPIDAKRPVTKKDEVRELRDKQLARLYNEAIDKGVKLIVLVDSCHSGSSARGISAGRTRRVEALMTVDMAQPPDPAELNDGERRKPEDRGALIMTASLDNELAEERSYEGTDHGDFSKALLDVLRDSNAGRISAWQLFMNVGARVGRGGSTTQHPSLSATKERRGLTLFGDPPSSDPAHTEVTVAVDASRNRIIIQNGLDIGLTRGSEFSRKDGVPVRIRISEDVTELSGSAAEVLSPAKTSDVRTGDVFVQDKWGSPGKPGLTVWLPPSRLGADELRAVAAEMSKLRSSDRVRWIDDPTHEAATHVVSFEDAGWQLTEPDGAVVKLSSPPTAEALLKLLPTTSEQDKPRLFVHLPPSSELRARLGLGAGTAKDAVTVTQRRDEALYVLVGHASRRAAGTTIEYAWVLPAATQGDAGGMRARSLPLPSATDWIDDDAATGKKLEEMALRLSKIRGYLTLTSPEQRDGHVFPYRLVIKNGGTGEEISDGGELVECETYVAELVADPDALRLLPKQRYVYVLGLDKYGNSALLFGCDNEGNRFPSNTDMLKGKAPRRIPLLDADFIVTGPEARCGINPNTGKPYAKGALGAETYLLLTSEQPLPLPELLEFSGVRTREQVAEMCDKGVRGGDYDLQNLLTDMESPVRTRGVTPAHWSVEQLSLHSVEKRP